MLPVSGGLAVWLLVEETSSPNHKNAGLLLSLWASLGLLLGGIVGFLLRPAAPLIGQLRFADVISRGRDLSGLNAFVLKLYAEQSFN
jgi:hypothetical protein